VDGKGGKEGERWSVGGSVSEMENSGKDERSRIRSDRALKGLRERINRARQQNAISLSSSIPIPPPSRFPFLSLPILVTQPLPVRAARTLDG
jgi:hypothetical protein